MTLNLGNKLSVVFSGILIIILGLLSTHNYLLSTEDTETSIQRYVHNLLDANVLIMDTWLRIHEEVINAITNVNINEPDLVREQLEILQKSGDYTMTFIGTSTGLMLRNASVTKNPANYDPRVRPWYKLGMEQKKLAYTDPYRAASSGKLVVAIAHKLNITDGEAVIAGNLSLELLNTTVDAMRSDISFGILTDKKGTILVHPNPDNILKDIRKVYPDITPTFLKNLEGHKAMEPVPSRINGKPSLIASEPIKRTNWYLILVIDEKKAYEHSQEILVDTIISSLAAIFITFILTLVTVRYLLKPLAQTNNALSDLAEGDGDLTIRLKERGNDEIAELAKKVNLFISKLHGIIGEIDTSGQKVSEQANNVQDMAQSNKQQLAQQQTQVTQIAAAVHEMSATAQEVASNAEATAAATKSSSENCDKGTRIILNSQEVITNLASEINRTSDAISELEANTQNINNILLTIQGIAEQTNLLALNAAIEAARAGEQGRGFAVVADEVRVLSQRTHNSTEEISSVIVTLLNNTENAVSAMKSSETLARNSVEEASNATDALKSISDSIAQISDMSTQIASAAEEQRAVTEEVSRNVESVSEVSENMVASASETIETADSLSSVSQNLNDQVGKFKL